MSLPQKTATAPKVIEKNTLPGLPEELLEAIAKECDPSDLLALRQASRLIHNGIDRTFLHEYFTDRNHFITVGSLEDLIHITATPRMGKTLEKLTLSMPWLSSKYDDHDCKGPMCIPPYKSRSGNCAVWAAWVKERSQLTNSMKIMVEKALRNIVSIEGTRPLYLRLQQRVDPKSRIHGRARFERYLNVPLYVPGSHDSSPLMADYSRDSTSALLYAIAESGVSLQELHFPRDFFFDYIDQEKELIPE